jgi:hypothetical protein
LYYVTAKYHSKLGGTRPSYLLAAKRSSIEEKKRCRRGGHCTMILYMGYGKNLKFAGIFTYNILIFASQNKFPYEFVRIDENTIIMHIMISWSFH